MENVNFGSVKKIGVAAGITLATIIGFFGSYYTVDSGEEAIVVRYGKVISHASEGLHFKLPILDDVEKFTTRTQTDRLEKMELYSKDQQPSKSTISITWSLKKGTSPTLYQHYRNLEGVFERVLMPTLASEYKNVFGKFNAEDAVTQRERLKTDVLTHLKANLSKTVPFINIQELQIEDIAFPDAYEKAVEEKTRADVEVRRAKSEAEKKKVENDIRVAQAEAEAKAAVLKAEAEAKAIKVKADALAQNPHLVKLEAIQKWDGQLPTIYGGNNMMPMLDINSLTSGK